MISSTIALFDIANVDALIIELPEADTLVCSQIAAAYKVFLLFSSILFTPLSLPSLLLLLIIEIETCNINELAHGGIHQPTYRSYFVTFSSSQPVPGIFRF